MAGELTVGLTPLTPYDYPSACGLPTWECGHLHPSYSFYFLLHTFKLWKFFSPSLSPISSLFLDIVVF